MVGVVLCGGAGTRLNLFTRRVTNKHAALVYNRPMIEFPLSSLSQAGIKKVAIVTGNTHAGVFGHLIGDGREFGFENVAYFIQVGEGGIADALRLTEAYVDGEEAIVILGDNVFEEDLSVAIEDYQVRPGRRGAYVILKPVADPERFGVAEIDDGKIISIEEKPKQPRSNLAITGCYLVDGSVYKRIQGLSISDRGEFEITDVLKSYLTDDLLRYTITEKFWSDVGTPDSLLMTAVWLKENEIKLVMDGRWSAYRFTNNSGLGDYLKSSYEDRMGRMGDQRKEKANRPEAQRSKDTDNIASSMEAGS